MDDRCDLLLGGEEEDRVTVRHQNAEHDPRLIGDDGIALDGLEVREVMIRVVEDQNVAAMGLLDGQQHMRLDAEGTGHG